MVQTILEITLHYFDSKLLIWNPYDASPARWKRPWKCTKEGGHQAHLLLSVEPLQAGATPLGVGPMGTVPFFAKSRYVTRSTYILNQQDTDRVHTRESGVICK